jgi:hypothetical protein
MPRDGCKECSRRRIKCDKGTPECTKCLKKGIQCTGVGRQIRFVEGAISKEKRKGHTISDVRNLATNLSRHLDDTALSVSQTEIHAGPPPQDTDVESPIGCVVDLGSQDADDDVEEFGLDVHQRQIYQPTRTPSDKRTTMSFHLDPAVDLSLELLKPGIQMLFDHCKLMVLLFLRLPGF